MKKLLLMFAAVAAMTFAACDNNNANQAQETQDSVPAFAVEQFDEALSNATDSAGVAELLNNAQAEVQKLVEAGDKEGAKTLLDKIKEIIEKNKEKLTAIVPSFAAMADKAIAAPEGLKDVINAAGDSVVEGAKDAVQDVKDAAAEKVNEAVDASKEKVNEAVDAGKEKAAEAVQGAAKKIGL